MFGVLWINGWMASNGSERDVYTRYIYMYIFISLASIVYISPNWINRASGISNYRKRMTQDATEWGLFCILWWNLKSESEPMQSILYLKTKCTSISFHIRSWYSNPHLHPHRDPSLFCLHLHLYFCIFSRLVSVSVYIFSYLHITHKTTFNRFIST